MSELLEVGKKYHIPKLGINPYKYICLDDGEYIFRNAHGSVTVASYLDLANIKEHREPYKFWLRCYFVYTKNENNSFTNVFKKYLAGNTFNSYENAEKYCKQFPEYKIGKLDLDSTISEDQQHD